MTVPPVPPSPAAKAARRASNRLEAVRAAYDEAERHPAGSLERKEGYARAAALSRRAEEAIQEAQVAQAKVMASIARKDARFRAATARRRPRP